MASIAARLTAGFFLLLAAACASVAPGPRELPQLKAVPRAFEMSGRIAVRQGQSSDIARLRWTHREGSDVWVIASPLGNEVARIEADARGARLAQGGGERTAESFEALTRELLGVELDPLLLAAWLHGLERDAAPSDWKVEIEETQPAGAVELARRLVARRGDVTVRLVVDDYRALAE